MFNKSTAAKTAAATLYAMAADTPEYHGDHCTLLFKTVTVNTIMLISTLKLSMFIMYCSEYCG